MVTILQVLGIGYILFMMYMTFLYYKKNNYSVQSFIFWTVVWAFGGVLLSFPQFTSDLTQELTLARVTDFYLIAGLMFFSMVCFFTYAAVKRTESKVEDLVRKIALQKKK